MTVRHYSDFEPNPYVTNLCQQNNFGGPKIRLCTTASTIAASPVFTAFNHSPPKWLGCVKMSTPGFMTFAQKTKMMILPTGFIESSSELADVEYDVWNIR